MSTRWLSTHFRCDKFCCSSGHTGPTCCLPGGQALNLAIVFHLFTLLHSQLEPHKPFDCLEPFLQLSSTASSPTSSPFLFLLFFLCSCYCYDRWRRLRSTYQKAESEKFFFFFVLHLAISYAGSSLTDSSWVTCRRCPLTLRLSISFVWLPALCLSQATSTRQLIINIIKLFTVLFKLVKTRFACLQLIENIFFLHSYMVALFYFVKWSNCQLICSLRWIFDITNVIATTYIPTLNTSKSSNVTLQLITVSSIIWRISLILPRLLLCLKFTSFCLKYAFYG